MGRFKPLLEKAAVARLPVRGYVSCALGCPYEGHVPPEDVAKVSVRVTQSRFDLRRRIRMVPLGCVLGQAAGESRRHILGSISAIHTQR